MRGGLILRLKRCPASATAGGAGIDDLKSAASEFVHVVQCAFVQKRETLCINDNTCSGFAKNLVCVATGAEFHLVLHSRAAPPFDGKPQALVRTGFFFLEQASQLMRCGLGYMNHDYLVFPTGDEVK